MRGLSRARERLTLSAEEALARRAVANDESELTEVELKKLILAATQPTTGKNLRDFFWKKLKPESKKFLKMKKSIRIILMILRERSELISECKPHVQTLLSLRKLHLSTAKTPLILEVSQASEDLLNWIRSKDSTICPVYSLGKHESFVLQFKKRLTADKVISLSLAQKERVKNPLSAQELERTQPANVSQNYSASPIINRNKKQSP